MYGNIKSSCFNKVLRFIGSDMPTKVAVVIVFVGRINRIKLEEEW